MQRASKPMPVLVRRSSDTGYINLLSILAISLLFTSTVFLLWLASNRRPQPQDETSTRSLPLSTFSPTRSSRRPSMPGTLSNRLPSRLRTLSSRLPSIPRTLSSLRPKIRRRVEQMSSPELITPPTPVHSSPRRTYEPPSAASSYASMAPLVPRRPTEHPRESQAPPPKIRKPVPGNTRLDAVYRHTPSPNRPPSKDHPAYRNQMSKSKLPQINVSSSSHATTRGPTHEGNDAARLAVRAQMRNDTTEVTVGRRRHINSAYAAHLKQKKARKPSMPPELYGSDDGTTEAGDTPYVGAGGTPSVYDARRTPYIEAPDAPYIGAERTPYVEPGGTRQVGARGSPYIEARGTGTPNIGPSVFKVSSPHFEQHRREVIDQRWKREAVNENYATRLKQKGVNMPYFGNNEDGDRNNGTSLPSRPYITRQGGRRDYDKEREQEARLRRLLESDTAGTTTDAGGGYSDGGGAAPYMDIRSAGPFPPYHGIGAAMRRGDDVDPGRKYPPMNGVRNACAAMGRGGRGDDLVVPERPRGRSRGRMGEIRKEAERRLKEMEMEPVQMPAPLRVRGRMNTE